ncbi:MAG: tetratricopeptide repeat protein [Desulfobacteraceae bacterium]|nr:MAG: tetratricopeptide repeat protein [Desulfobacteraceae bacterium]
MKGRNQRVADRTKNALADKAYLSKDNPLAEQNDGLRAVEKHQHALLMEPPSWETQYNCGVAAHHDGKLNQAVLHYAAAIRHNPALAEAHFNMAHALSELNRFAEAEAAYKTVLDLQPSNAAAAYNLGLLYQSAGRYAQAINAFQQSLKLQPDHARALNNIGVIWRAQDKLGRARVCFERALNIDPNLVEALYNLGITLHRSDEFASAQAFYRQALFLKPDYAPARWLHKLGLPMLYASEAEIHAQRNRFTENLNELIENTPLHTPEEKRHALEGISASTNFFLQYQGMDDLELQKKYGHFVAAVMAANYPRWSSPRPIPRPTAAGSRIRLGYVSSCMYAHTIGIFLMGWLEKSDRRDFEIFCYHLGDRTDPMTAQLRGLADHFFHFPHNVAAAAAQIESDNLHILVHTDIGMNPVTLLLAGLRLAPVQCKGWGHPVTTGLPTIDYYLSSDMMEPDQAERFYSEKLIRLPNLALNYTPPPLPGTPKTKGQFGIPHGRVMYLSTQSLFKYLPQHDDIYPRIAREVPDALFVFIAHGNAGVTGKLKRRLSQAFEKEGARAELIFVPRLTHADFLGLNLAADVLLDTLEWSGGKTTLEAIACDLPVVTCPGRFMRGRHAYAFLKRMGLKETMAVDKDEYVRIAVHLGRDALFRTQVRDRIRRTKSMLFNDASVVQALEAFYRRVCASGI